MPTPFEPKPQPVDSICKECQEFYYVYPVRFALSEQAFKNIETAGTVPTLPTGSTANADYELRRLRDGYVYILAGDMSSPRDLSAITAKAGSPKAWYIYRYHSPELESLSSHRDKLPMPYHFRQYHCENGDLSQNWTVNPLSTPCIMLNKAIKQIEIMYSDFALPIALLNKLAADIEVRRQWMKHVVLRESAVDILTLSECVKDFSPDAKFAIQEPSNQYRFSTVGRIPTGFIPEITPRGNEQGEIVALEDMVGTMRDLAHFHVYLDDKRKAILQKYEYAITTAQLIHAYMQRSLITTNQRLKANYERLSSWGRGRGLTYTPDTLAMQYQSLKGVVQDEHLQKNAHQDIFNQLKRELALDDEIPGLNAIAKMANITGRFGKPFSYLVQVHTQLISGNEIRRRIELLKALLTQDNVSLMDNIKRIAETVADSWCLLTHGLYYGLDFTPIGQNAMVAALAGTTEALAPDMQRPADFSFKALKENLSDLKSVFDVLKTSAETHQLNVATFDLVADIFVDKIYLQQLGRKSNFTLTHQKIQAIYQVYPKTGNAKLVKRDNVSSQGKVPKNVRKLKQTYHLENARLPTLENGNYQLFQITDTPAGLKKLLVYAPLFEMFMAEESKAHTREGQLAESPAVSALTLFIGEFADDGALKANVNEALRELKQHTDITRKGRLIFVGKSAYTSNTVKNLTLIKNAVISANSLLAGVGALVEFGSWKEAEYKGDRIMSLSATAKGIGGLMVEAGMGGLGILYAAKINSALLAGGLTALAYLFIVAGAVAVVAGTIYSLFAPEEMELWIRGGFWGNSVNYWGTPVKAYDWTNERYNIFWNQFTNSYFNYHDEMIISQNIIDFYQIEMQRYFRITEEIKLSSLDKYTVLVEHSSIDKTLAKQIQVTEVQLLSTLGGFHPSPMRPRIEFIEAGKAKLIFSEPWRLPTRSFYESKAKYSGNVNDERILQMKVKVTMPDYNNAEKRFTSKLTLLDLIGYLNAQR
ncbi:hypothetical protein EDC44_11027 [Cricetibacter osteomyelitidis]|uniref:Toxin VasX N-terminal region domain-containing protein n=1 Tax=Cricetibacter osteomyelitidis TaxID=1521931 RepID=A0A4R2T212_9PAST|nr:toxin VasX [Cricetibacter osteomyelitidis]TCP95196.1 hypothetical protein EDC44_11027 [Cricetibacter osteomyelitidis]